jgi:hypothetical protein
VAAFGLKRLAATQVLFCDDSGRGSRLFFGAGASAVS